METSQPAPAEADPPAAAEATPQKKLSAKDARAAAKARVELKRAMEAARLVGTSIAQRYLSVPLSARLHGSDEADEDDTTPPAIAEAAHMSEAERAFPADVISALNDACVAEWNGQQDVEAVGHRIAEACAASMPNRWRLSLAAAVEWLD